MIVRKIFIFALLLFLFNSNVLTKQNFKLGTPAPSIKIYKWMNKTPDFKTLNGKTIILEFWATWCRPCLKMIPHLNNLVEKVANDSVIFISITKESPQKIEKFLEKKTLKSYVAIDYNGITNKNYKILTIPHAYVIDSNGLIVWEGHPAILTEKILKFIIAKKHYKKADEVKKKQ